MIGGCAGIAIKHRQAGSELRFTRGCDVSKALEAAFAGDGIASGGTIDQEASGPYEGDGPNGKSRSNRIGEWNE